ncbi:hypothetical protein CRM22_009302 [Opisthorchis felineus]|uniref:Enkurin domain-containing protein n=1 Tax=Opisthorchis felineus TaxID=147828 RepID=A0A4S2L822_OPIFE|nr:hypothetical protein CRM22_009302 [Opisthorchis felineus]
MTSNVSGPIPTHEVYFGAPILCEQQKPLNPFEHLGILQWESNASSVHANRPVTASALVGKDHIRENIRRIRDYQRYGARRHLQGPMQHLRMHHSPRPSSAGSKSSQYLQKKRLKKNIEDPPARTGLGDQSTLNDDQSTQCSLDPHSSGLQPNAGSPVVRVSQRQESRPPLHCRATQCSIQETAKTVSQGVQANAVESSRQGSSLSPKGRQALPKRPTSVQLSRIRAASASPAKRDFLRAHEKTTPGKCTLEELGNIPLSKPIWTPRPERLSVPAASSAKTVQLIRRNINYVRANAHLIGIASRNSSSRGSNVGGSGPTSYPNSPKRSQVTHFREPQMWPERQLPVGGLPAYLIRERHQAAAAAAQEAASRPDPDQPPGHVRMPDADRVNTLELLRKAHAELTEEWFKLPVRMDTMRIRARRSELEQRLIELEQAISIFDKPKVFIKPE